MDRSEVITLIKTNEQTQDANGVWHKTQTERQVFCQVNSVTRSEFFEAGRAGLNPEYEFTLFFADYEGEELIEYKGKRYAVYRTYIGRNDIIELYTVRKGGTN